MSNGFVDKTWALIGKHTCTQTQGLVGSISCELIGCHDLFIELRPRRPWSGKEKGLRDTLRYTSRLTHWHTHTHAHRCVLTHTVTQINITVRSNKNSQDSTMFSVRTVSNVCVCTPPHICIICSHLCSLREHFCCVIPVIVSQKIKVLHGIAIWHICSALRGAEWARELGDFRSYRNVLVFFFFFC